LFPTSSWLTKFPSTMVNPPMPGKTRDLTISIEIQHEFKLDNVHNPITHYKMHFLPVPVALALMTQIILFSNLACP
jgi:hypothetical protein